MNPMPGATLEWASSADSVAVVGATRLLRTVGNEEAVATASVGVAFGDRYRRGEAGGG